MGKNGAMADTSDPSPTHRASKLAAPLLAGVLILGASSCTKKDDGASTTGTTAAGGGSSTTKAAAGGGGGGSTGSTTDGGGSATGTTASGTSQVNLKKTVWISGFKVTLGEVTFDEKQSLLEFAYEAENLSKNDSALYSSYLLEADGAQIATGGLDETKVVVSGQKVKGKIQFHGMGEKGGTPYKASSTTLVIGAGSESQVRVQIDGKGTKDVDNKPIDQEFKKTIELGQGSITIDKTQIRYDNVPYASTTAKEGHAYLVMTGSWKNNAAESTTLYMTTDKLVVKGPDGTEYTSDSFATETSLAKTKKDDKMVIVWDLETPFKGDWSLDITQEWDLEGAEVKASVPFTLTDTAAATEDKKEG